MALLPYTLGTLLSTLSTKLYNLLGTKIGSPLTNGSQFAKFGTHRDILGIGGYRTVYDTDARDAIPVKSVIEDDGGSSGMRREGMIVYVQDTKKTYQLTIPNFTNLSDYDKLSALEDNNNWQEIQFGVSTTPSGETIIDITFINNILTFVTNVTTRTFDFSSLAGGNTVIDFYLTNDNKLNLIFNNGANKIVDLSFLKYDDTILTTRVTDLENTSVQLEADINTQKDRIDTLVNGAPTALDTLKEIADQIASDEAGVAAILATQQQHTTQITTINTSLDNKVDKVTGKALSTNDYTTAEKNKLASLTPVPAWLDAAVYVIRNGAKIYIASINTDFTNGGFAVNTTILQDGDTLVFQKDVNSNAVVTLPNNGNVIIEKGITFKCQQLVLGADFFNAKPDSKHTISGGGTLSTSVFYQAYVASTNVNLNLNNVTHIGNISVGYNNQKYNTSPITGYNITLNNVKGIANGFPYISLPYYRTNDYIPFAIDIKSSVINVTNANAITLTSSATGSLTDNGGVVRVSATTFIGSAGKDIFQSTSPAIIYKAADCDYEGFNAPNQIFSSSFNPFGRNNSSAIDESNLVHKTGDETIAGNKTFTDKITANEIETSNGYKINNNEVLTYSPGNLVIGGGSGIFRTTFKSGDYEWYTSGGSLGMSLASGGNLFVNNNIRASYFIGDGSQLINLPIPNSEHITDFSNDTGKLTITTDKNIFEVDLNTPTNKYLSGEILKDPEFNLAFTDFEANGYNTNVNGWMKTHDWYQNGGTANISVTGSPQCYLFQDVYLPAAGKYEVKIKANSVTGAGIKVLITADNIAGTPIIYQAGDYTYYFNSGSADYFRFHLLAEQSQTITANIESCSIHQVQIGAVYGDDKFIHLFGDENIKGNKTFQNSIIANQATIDSGVNRPFSINTNSGSADIIASFTAPNAPTLVSFGIGRDLVSNGGFALIGYKKSDGSAFLTTAGRPIEDFVLNTSGNIGIGKAIASERVDVDGNVKANYFIGDGSQLTNLQTVTIEQDLSSNSTTSVPSVAAAANIVQYYNLLTDFPAVGNTNTLYCLKRGYKLYNWSGTSYQEISKVPVVQVTGQSSTNVMSQNAVTNAINNLVIRNISFAYLAVPNESNSWYRYDSTTDKEFTIYSEGNLQSVIGNHFFIEQVGTGILNIVPRAVAGFPAPTLTTINCNPYTEGKGSILHLIKVSSDNWILYPVNNTKSSSTPIRFAEYTATVNGVQNIALGAGAKEATLVQVLESSGFVRTVYLTDYSVANDTLTINADANIVAGDKIVGLYTK